PSTPESPPRSPKRPIISGALLLWRRRTTTPKGVGSRSRRIRRKPQCVTRPRVKRIHHFRRDNDEELRLVALEARAREELAEDRDVLQERQSGTDVFILAREHAGDDEALVLAHIECAAHAARAECRHAESLQGDRVGEVEARDFWR